MVWVVKCYFHSRDVLAAADAKMQKRLAFAFSTQFFKNLESLIVRDFEGRLYRDSQQHRVKFYLDLKAHAGFRLDEEQSDPQSPLYDESAIQE